MKKEISHILYITLGILAVNVLSMFLFLRLDFTANERYSLSPVSKQMIRNNKLPVTVDLYITQNLPQELNKLAREFIYLLKEYKSFSRVNFTINTIVPDNDLKSHKAVSAGIRPMLIEISDRDFEKVQNIYMGASFRIGNKRYSIPFINSRTPLEYEITRLLKLATDTVKPRVGLIQGHREALLGEMPQLINELSQLTDISLVDLNRYNHLNHFNVLCIIAPKDTFSLHERKILDEYLGNGGRLFVALNHAIGQLNRNQNTGFINPTGVEDFLEEKGLKIQYDFVIDNNCGSIPLNIQKNYPFSAGSISFPYLPVITHFSKHTITHGLKAILLQFASSIRQVKTNTTYLFTSLATTSSIAGRQQAPLFFDLNRPWTRQDFNKPRSIVAALLTNEDNHSAIVTITDADFLLNDVGLYTHPLSPDNVNFAVNSIEWLADNSGLIGLRNKFTTFRSLEPTDEYVRVFLKYLNFLLPLVIVISAATIRFRIKRRQRINRMRPGYID
ncbi:MAG: GldG family protein [Culturomica sp.]|jgi:gliding-associated putative ABC transporter substrate-binding component GldG|nr:GldG family protein [Culturomica sp.]